MRKLTFTILGLVAATSTFGLIDAVIAHADPAPAQVEAAGSPRCPAPSEASYPFTCTHIGADTLRICAPSKGCADQSFDKLGNLVCQKMQLGAQVAPNVPLTAADPAGNVFYAVCDSEMSLVRALPPLPVGGVLPAFKG